MAEEKKKEVHGTGSLSADALEAEDVLSGAEPWEPWETKLVVGSFIVAFIILLIGLFIVPTSIINAGG
ncbi:hypothetical protein [Thermodesulfatator autotrophicus]|uniref:Uncharacterized protein n=1 Tax=Thermodesulfatator autotrophicus TaxID=1795632 RepID=A0A177E5F4_9BACT|nr:hypothetical protein [Thermodesulfatator autotrophicus]OAG26946.1 hypothetical protein TH606_09580 [Thermodesulfatator autotrophicus]